MIKLVFTLRRRPDLTPEQFHSYWRGPHAELVARHAPTLRIRRYVQTQARPSELDGVLAGARESTPQQYDGLAELWWDSLDDLVAANTSEAGQLAAGELLEDERRFIDLPNSPIWLGEETVVIGPA
jgi:EthD domain